LGLLRKLWKQFGGKELKYKKTVYQALAMLGQFGISILVPIFLCSFFGIFLDRKLGTSYWMVILFFVGALAGFRNVYLLAKRIYGGGREETPGGTDSGTHRENK